MPSEPTGGFPGEAADGCQRGTTAPPSTEYFGSGYVACTGAAAMID